MHAFAGEKADKAPLLSSIQLVVARSGAAVAPCGPGADDQLKVGVCMWGGTGGQ